MRKKNSFLLEMRCALETVEGVVGRDVCLLLKLDSRGAGEPTPVELEVAAAAFNGRCDYVDMRALRFNVVEFHAARCWLPAAAPRQVWHAVKFKRTCSPFTAGKTAPFCSRCNQRQQAARASI